jgi:hypothetical protein
MTFVVAALFATTLFAVEPETCIAPGGTVIVEHAEKRYALASIECRDLFLTDPERYSQLFDALTELAQTGKRVAPSQPSLVPS